MGEPMQVRVGEIVDADTGKRYRCIDGRWHEVMDEEEDRATKLLAESLGATDCGGNGRDFCCSYHEGVADGLDAAFAWVREADGE